MSRIRFVAALLVLASCAAPQAEPAASPTNVEVTHGDRRGLRTAEEVEQALDRAQAAYMDARWGDVVVESTKIIEGAATPEQYYAAVKLLGLGSCNRKDPRPVAFAWKRLQPADRASLRNECDQHGLTISDDGVVTKQ